MYQTRAVAMHVCPLLFSSALNFALAIYPRISTQLCRTVTWFGEADGHSGVHIDAGAETAALQAKLAVSDKEVRLVRQFPDGTQLVEARSSKGLLYLESEKVFKWSGPKKNTGPSIKELVVQVPTGRCSGARLSGDPTMQHCLLHKNVESYDVVLLYVMHLCLLSLNTLYQK
jgi:hypothetical protein